jgi:DNA mismatch repair protein MutL
MARPDVAFALEHDGPPHPVGPAAPLPQRVRELLDPASPTMACRSTHARRGRPGGVVSLPTFTRGAADQQYLFVNAGP